MQSLDFRRYSLICAAGMLAGCGGSLPQTSAPASLAMPGQSPMLPAAKRDDLLYVSYPGAGAVAVYTFPGGKFVGTLTGLSSPEWLCSDGSGNVWIPNAGAGTLVEYAHGGSQPIGTLSVPKGEPGDCSVDPVTGDIAVTGYNYTFNHTFLVYPHGQGTPVKHRVNFLPTGVAYDDHGNLFIDGRRGLLALGELPRGKSKVRTFSVGNYDFFGQVQWDGKYVDVSAYEYIFRFAIQGKTAVNRGQIILDVGKYVGGYWIEGSKVVATNWFGSRSYPWVARIFKYPAGGEPTKTISGTAGWGVTVSKAPPS